MTSGPLTLRLFRVRALVSETALDVRLRDAVLPALASHALVADAWVGRRRTEDGDERCVVAVTGQPDPLADLLGDPPVLERLDASLPPIEPIDVLALPLSVAVTGEHEATGRVLRVVAGATRAGQLARYVERVEAGALADVARRHGPLRLYLAVPAPDRFLTVSTWADWGDIEASTGSDARRPNATRHPELLDVADVAHYEVLPGAVPLTMAG